MSALVAIIYDTGSGHTAALAASIAAGAIAKDVKVADINLAKDSFEFETLAEADAIIFGAPTYMGGVSARFNAFMDASSDIWLDQPWHNKIAGGLTIGTNRSGGKFDDAEIARNPDGSWLGLMETSIEDKSKLIDAGDALTAGSFGRRIASAAKRWRT